MTTPDAAAESIRGVWSSHVTSCRPTESTHGVRVSGAVALATCARLPECTTDDRLLVDALTRRGVRAEGVVWDSAADWSAYSSVVIRSCWDYYHRLPDFLAWLDQLEAVGATVMNPVPLLRWNSHKHYLRDLAERGVPVVPTRWLDTTSATSLSEVLTRAGWERVVVKPSVSAAAHDTWRTTRGTAAADEARLQSLLARGPVLVQPFLDAVIEQGEWSLIFIAGSFSHAVIKRPRAGDFRVQPEHGGSAASATPDASLIGQAADVLRAAGPLAETSLYARVDGCVVDGVFLLMELELIEPALFLATAPGAADRLADALVVSL